MNTNRMSALGMYLVNKFNKNFNFKAIRGDLLYRDILFNFNNVDYLVCEDEYELEDTINILEFKFKIKDYPPKLIKKYTHKKFDKINKKKRETVIYKGKKYFIIQL